MTNTEKEIVNQGLIQTGDHILVGLSGGADSVCLCHLLWSLQKSLHLSLRAVHVHHGIRGEEADRDAAFCKDFCKTLSIPFELVYCSVPEECAKTKESEETCARRLRYKAFEQLAKPQEKIATAHTVNDNAETVLFHLTRGCGVKGLAGIPKQRGNIVRPILFMEREETEAYCHAHGLSFVTDSTNLSQEYTRNFLRSEVIQPLLKVNPSFLHTISRTTTILEGEAALLEDVTQNALQQAQEGNALKIAILQSYKEALALRVILQKLKNTWHMDFTYAHAKAVYGLLSSGNEATVLGKHTVYKTKEYLSFGAPKKSCAPWCVSMDLESLSEQTVKTPLGDLKIQKLSTKDLQNFDKDYFRNAIDCATIGTVLNLRSRCAGDKFTHPKRKVTKLLKKWFSESNIPTDQRNAYPVLASETEVLWAYPFGVSLPYRANSHATKILLLTMQNGGNTND